MLNVATLLETTTRRTPTKTAIIYETVKMTYAEVNGAANMIANGLVRAGVEPGDKIALLLPNIPQFAIAYYAILKVGAIVVPLNVLFKQNEIAYHLDDSESVALIAFEGFLAEAAPAVARAEHCRNLFVVQAPGSTAELPAGAQPSTALMAGSAPIFESYPTSPADTAVILYTSGTTGRPKGAELSHSNMFMNATISADRVLLLGDGAVGLAVLPLFHSFGQSCVMNVLFYSGGTMTLLPRFEPQKALEIMVRDKVNFFAGVPTMYFYLLNFPGADQFDLSSLERCISGGSAMPVEVMLAFNKKYNVQIIEGYGLSETSPVASFNHLDQPTRPGSIGTPMWGVELRVTNDEGSRQPDGELGEIAIRGHNVMKGYYNRAEATSEVVRNGWFHTGDIGYRDGDGFFYIKDRVKDMILRGGFNVYPREIEEILYAHPAVAEAAVIGVPDAALGEEIRAVVALKPGQQATAEELIAYCKERLAAYKYPRTVVFLDTLPKTATGKILKRELKDL